MDDPTEDIEFHDDGRVESIDAGTSDFVWVDCEIGSEFA